MENIIDVSMNEIKVSTLEQPIIGTSALATCVGFLAYSQKTKKALVVHFAPDGKFLIPEVFVELNKNNMITNEEYNMCIKLSTLFDEYELYEYNASLREQFAIRENNKIAERIDEDKIEIKIIPGYMPNSTNIEQHLETLFSSINTIFKINKNQLSKNAVKTEMITSNEGGNCFYFDASIGQYITNKILTNSNLEDKNIKK